ncbi:MarR family transcriptional regulator [Streptomyces sp. 205]|uniref:MarR family transcriptional regulator n=2 Tax=Streptomyces coffeae TaxID=621382 RepID=A0ABS1N6P4_9ACTN|nr:MarR family transcriptional regulator [Streptomyces coffeae]
MLVARCHVFTPRERKAAGAAGADGAGAGGAGGTEAGVDRCGPDRLDRSAYFLLSRLDAEGAMSIGQLADAFHLDVSTVNRQTGTLVRSGLLERIPDPDGGLARKLRATTLGADRFTAERDRRRAALAGILEGWAEEEVARFEEMLTRFNREVETREGRAWPREDDRADDTAGV